MASNKYGFAVPDCNFGGAINTMLYERGYLMVNLGSKFDVFDCNGSRCGGIGTKESYVVIGRIASNAPHSWGMDGVVMVFTNGAGQPTVAYTVGGYGSEGGNCSSWASHFHTTNSAKDGVFKTYNRTINFFGYNCPPGTYVAPTLFRMEDLDFAYAGDETGVAVTLPLTDLSRANTISIKSAVINGNVVSSPRISSLSYPDNEYCVTHVTDRGVNNDVEGRW
ncbi:hypothetical protein [Clostridium manihotivorum]|uniref:Uncharacterized protein n=1 Tax=Clostridium manihotivorum TaxID=2320868 RepID=A0A3R5QVI3_9CLOT|nr:hypothetical protein [Clostridium manihotivorum]QAA30503.1 hypothetical protein C1I91_01820 [Clostridium manihotivorum]